MYFFVVLFGYVGTTIYYSNNNMLHFDSGPPNGSVTSVGDIALNPSLCKSPGKRCEYRRHLYWYYRETATVPAYDLVLAVRRRRLRYLGHVLRMPADKMVRCALMALRLRYVSNGQPVQ